MLGLALVEKKYDQDKLIAVLVSGGIWFLYLIRPIMDQFYYDWARFSFGCMIGILGAVYAVHVLIRKLEKYITS